MPHGKIILMEKHLSSSVFEEAERARRRPQASEPVGKQRDKKQER